MSPGSPGIPFDRVVVPAANGLARGYTAQEFLSLPLGERIGYVLAGDMRFFDRDAEVEPRHALRWLREGAARR